MFTKFLGVIALVFALVFTKAHADQSFTNPALQWNQHMLNALIYDNTGLFFGVRNYEIFWSAQYAALKELGCYQTHKGQRCNDRTATIAMAAAGHYVLATLHNTRFNEWAAVTRAVYRAEPDQEIREVGTSAGNRGARFALKRVLDNMASFRDIQDLNQEDLWAPVPPAYVPYFHPTCANESTSVLPHPSVIHVPAPPPVSSEVFAASLQLTRTIGDSSGAALTDDQKDIAWFWATFTGTSGICGLYSKALSYVIRERELDMYQTTTIFKLLGMTTLDSLTVNAWWKQVYFGIRPITAIHQGFPTFNPDIVADPNWNSFIPSPPNGEWPCGHCQVTKSFAVLAEKIFGSDNIPYSIVSDPLNNVALQNYQRNFTSFSQAADEAAWSRIYGGVHLHHSLEVGIDVGVRVAEYVFDTACPGGSCLDGSRQIHDKFA